MPLMKICIFGATGPTGRELVAQALEHGHAVTAFARRPAMLNVPAIQGDATRDYEAVAQAVSGQDAVLSALGIGARFTPDAFMLRSVRNIERAMLAQGVQRLIVMSAFGVGETRRDAPLVPRLMYCTLLSAVFADKLAAESELRATQLEWTLAYPVLLTNGPRTGRYRAGERLELAGLPTISRADVAHFMVGEVSRREFVRKGVVLAY
jgi:putative NADH-flavin reductase